MTVKMMIMTAIMSEDGVVGEAGTDIVGTTMMTVIMREIEIGTDAGEVDQGNNIISQMRTLILVTMKTVIDSSEKGVQVKRGNRMMTMMIIAQGEVQVETDKGDVMIMMMIILEKDEAVKGSIEGTVMMMVMMMMAAIMMTMIIVHEIEAPAEREIEIVIQAETEIEIVIVIQEDETMIMMMRMQETLQK